MLSSEPRPSLAQPGSDVYPMTLHLPTISRPVLTAYGVDWVTVQPEDATNAELNDLAVALREQQATAWQAFEDEIRRVDRVRYARAGAA